MTYSLDFAACAQIGEHGIDAILIDEAQTGVRNAQAHETVFAFHPETAVLQVRQEAPLRLVVRVGNVVAAHRRFPSYLAYACHMRALLKRLNSGFKPVSGLTGKVDTAAYLAVPSMNG